jgi:hypothetical protein
MEFIFRAPLFHLDSLWAIYYLPLRWTSLTAIKLRGAFSHLELSEFKGKIMRISSTDVIEGGRVLYSIGKIKAASAWHTANGTPAQANWRELVVSELIRKAEDIDADAIIALARCRRVIWRGSYQNVSRRRYPFQKKRPGGR